MFHQIPTVIKERMELLEKADAKDRQDDTPRLQRLRQIPPESGKAISILAASAPEGEIVEIGTSAGYSTLWIILACRYLEKIVKTFEILPAKIKLAEETFSKAKVESYVELIYGDARVHLKNVDNISFCFLDAEKEYYDDCYDLIIPKLVKGGFFVADNVISHEEELQPFIERTMTDPRVDTLILPIGKGLLLSRKI
ncbi:methyltransferase [Candidatus Heimdallarchaeota archaeon B3_Heim]|nr:MAG: methyltransferase [Candidatus Heimdallarchaeota archaeon B3_Heim]